MKLPFVDRVKFLVERQFVKGAGFQLLVVAAVIALISLSGGLAVWLASGERSLADSIWWAFLRLTDPGYLGDDVGTWPRVISTILTVLGYVVFLGALVAIMTQWLIARMREFERGLTPVALRDHVVIVGWTNRTIPLLRELVGTERSERRFLSAFGTRRLRPVVLSEDVSAVEAQEIRSDPVIGREARRIILRYGSALEEEAIQRAACLDAAAVIMPAAFRGSAELVSPDIEMIRVLLSMDARAEQLSQAPPLVIAEIQDARREEMAQRAYRGPLELVPSDDTISRLLVQNILHPGLSAFFREALTAREGNEFYLREPGEMAGATLGEFAARCPRGIVCGLLRPGSDGFRPLLNAPTAMRLERDDLVVVLARTFDETDPMRGSKRLAAVRREAAGADDGGRTPAEHRILVLGWNHRVPNLLHELSGYARYRFSVDLVSTVDIEERRRAIEQYSSRAAALPIEHSEADYLLSGVMDRLEPDRYSSIVLTSSDRLDSIEEADARSIVGHRLIEGLLHGAVRRPQVLIELADAANEGLVRAPGAETLVSPLIMSHVLAQVTLRRESRIVFDELFTPGGGEILFRAAREYRIREAMSFADMEEKVAAAGDTLLGFRPTASSLDELLLNPPRDAVLDPSGFDSLVVLGTVR
ncbi:MAG: hypothetical protein R3323_03825 [Wenzhouxiangellaceae bacterium]|nr:hypothetical protein [Wenzhouxiangellaceae bacterium]